MQNAFRTCYNAHIIAIRIAPNAREARGSELADPWARYNAFIRIAPNARKTRGSELADP